MLSLSRHSMLRKSGLCLFAILTLSGEFPCSASTPPPVPTSFQDLYSSLNNYLDSFNTTLNSQWNGVKYPVLFTANLWDASAEGGPQQMLGAGAADCAVAAAGVTIRASAAIVAPISVRFVSDIIFPPASLIPALQLEQHLRRRLPVSQLSKLDSRTSIESRCIECQRPRTSQYYAREARKSGSASFQAIFHTSPSIFTKRCCKLVRDQLSIRAGNTGAHFVGLEPGSEGIQLSRIFTVCLVP